jgi:hypothetical protein
VPDGKIGFGKIRKSKPGICYKSQDKTHEFPETAKISLAFSNV